MSLLSRTGVRMACVKSIYAWCGVSYFSGTPATPAGARA